MGITLESSNDQIYLFEPNVKILKNHTMGKTLKNVILPLISKTAIKKTFHNFKFFHSETEMAVQKHDLYWFSHKRTSGEPIYSDFLAHNL